MPLADGQAWQSTLDQSIQQAANLQGYDPQELAVTHDWVVGLADGADASQVAAGVGADSLGACPPCPTPSFGTSPRTSRASRRRRNTPTGADGITYAYPAVVHDAETLSLPNDIYFPQQWHLNNTAGVGQDLNLRAVWDFANGQGLGSGVVIGVVDDGVQGNHPDLRANYQSSLSASIDSLGNRNNSLTAAYPVGSTDNHGTALAGIAAAVDTIWGFPESGPGPDWRDCGSLRCRPGR